MKKNILIVLSLIAALPGYLIAQSFSIPNPTYTHVSDLSSNTATVSIPILNASNFTLDVIVSKVSNNVTPPHASKFCFGISCYDTSETSSGVISFGANSTEYLIADLDKYGAVGNSDVTYRIFDTNNPSDFSEVQIFYTVTTGIKTLNEESTISQPQPNPADKFSAVSYSLKGNAKSYQIAIYNILGKTVKEILLNESEGTVLLPTAELKSGVYFYSLRSGNKVLSTNKLIVAHKN